MLFNLNDDKMTALETMVLTSHENANKVLTEFNNWYFHGNSTDNIQEVLDEICIKLHIYDGDLLPEDIDRITNYVKRYC